MSSLSEKLVDFDIMVESEPRPVAPAKPTGLTEQTSSLEESIYRLSGSFSSIQRTQRYFRTRENRNVRRLVLSRPCSSLSSLLSFFSLAASLLLLRRHLLRRLSRPRSPSSSPSRPLASQLSPHALTLSLPPPRAPAGLDRALDRVAHLYLFAPRELPHGRHERLPGLGRAALLLGPVAAQGRLSGARRSERKRVQRARWTSSRFRALSER